MTRRHQTETEMPFGVNRPEDNEKAQSKLKQRIRKWGKKAVATTLLAGSLAAGYKGVEAVNASMDAKEQATIKELDAEFGEKLEPVAKRVAEDAYKNIQDVEAHRSDPAYRNKSAAIVDAHDPTKLVMRYTVKVPGGTYEEEVTVAKKADGEPNLDEVLVAKVSARAEKETAKQPLLRDVITITHGGDSTYTEKKFQYWGASFTSDSPLGKTATNKDGIDGFNTFYDHENRYNNKKDDLKRADLIANTLLPSTLAKLNEERPIV